MQKNFTIVSFKVVLFILASFLVSPVWSQVDYANLQFPGSATINTNQNVTVYGRVYKSGVTDAQASSPRITAWVGYSSQNVNPADPSFTWVPASMNTKVGNDFEFMASIGIGLNAGTYYYATRFQLDGGVFRYGGFSGGFWNGTSNVNGILTINAAPVTINASAGANGTISPIGITTLPSGSSQTYTITPNAGYQVANVSVDGSSNGAVGSYTFNNVTTNHAISVSFVPLINYVYHEASTNNAGCGLNNYRSTQIPTSTESLTASWKIEYQFSTNHTALYYTTDGSNPTGSKGIGSGSTVELDGNYNCTFNVGGLIVDVANATIPVLPEGTIVKYIIGAWNSGGGNEIFANSGTSNSPLISSSTATIFNYTVAKSTTEVDYANTQFPQSATIATGGTTTVYAQVFEPGVTEAAGQGAGISAWIGYSSLNVNPSDPSFTWVPATFNTQSGNNDEYKATIGSTLPAGIYYYASRFQITGGPYKYGGYNNTGGGFWNGTTNVSGVLTIKSPAQALNFDGASNYVSVPTGIGNDLNNFTIEGWINPTLFNGQFRTILDYNTWETGALHLQLYPDNRLEFAFNGAGSIYSNSTFTANTWKHFAITYTSAAGSHTMKIYINGVLETSTTISGLQSLIGNKPFNIGSWVNSRFFGGSMDELRVWNYERTQTQIQDAMNCDVPQQGGLIMSFRFNEGIANGNNSALTQVLDYSGNSTCAFLNKFALTGNTSNWTTGNITSCNAVTPLYSEINIKGNGINIIDDDVTPSVNDNTDFGTAGVKVPVEKVYIIENKGTTPLTVSSIISSGANSSDFTISGISLPTSIQVGGTASFTVTLSSATGGNKAGTITINNNDCDEASYDFGIAGTVTAIPATALNFNGVNNFVASTSSLMNNLSAFTVEGWVFPKSLSGIHSLFGQNDVLEFYMTANSINFWTPYGSGSVNYTMPLNTWHHIALVANGRIVTTYVDGVSKGIVNFTTNSYGSSTSPFTFGAYTTDNIGGGNPYPFNGHFDEIRLWNRALCQGEIQNNLNNELSSGQTGLIAYYKLNNGFIDGNNTGLSTAFDASGNGNNSTLKNFTLTGTTSNWVAGTVTGFAPDFISPSVTISPAGISTICPGTSITLSANSSNAAQPTYQWFKNGSAINGATADTYSANSAGQYTVSVSSNGCSATSSPKSISINSFVATKIVNAPKCSGENGTVVISANGGSSNYTGIGTFTVAGGAPYSFNVSDGTCSTTISGTMPAAPQALFLSSNNTPILCNGGSSAVTILASGGVGSYTGLGTFSQAVGKQTYTVTDANSCSKTIDVVVFEPTAILLSETHSDVSCSGRADGAIELTVTGGTQVASTLAKSPYTYFWAPSDATTKDLSNLIAGNYIVTVKDANNCTATKSINISLLQDVTAPIQPILADINAECSATATAPTTTDNCAGTVIGTTTDGLTYNTQGIHLIHWTFDDGNGNKSEATQNLIIKDVTVPVQPILADITAECSATATAPTTTDNCAGTVIGTTTDALIYSTQGTHVITWTFNDGNGNQTIATQNVIIKDATAPVKPILADITAECSATATAPTTTDNCAGAVIGTTTDALTYSTQGTHVITWTFNDGNGNQTIATQNVIIKDVTVPVQPILADITGECSATATAPTTTDNCVGTVIGTTTDALTYSTQGTHVITWTFNDGNGNKTEATQNVIIKDVTAPVQPILADITAECSATATAPTTTDNCAGTVIGTTTDGLTYSTQGTHVITWTFNDGNGNQTIATQNVIIKDVTVPVQPILADITGECSATATAPTTTDNCSGTVIGTTTDALTYNTQGIHLIHWTFDDGNGNKSEATQNVIIKDVTAPVQPILADITAECSATATAPTTTDNCVGTVIGTTTDALIYSTQGTHVITWTFNDGNGNQTIATQNVIIKDATAPVKPILADITAECSATATAPTSTDNCAGTVTGTTTDTLTYSTQGTHVITWTFNDGNGNQTIATQNVIIKDVTAPVKPMLADITAECSATATAPTATDNCIGAVIGTTTDALTYSTQGKHVITWTFNDGNGNQTIAKQCLIVKDVTAPVKPILADITAECSATATAPATTDNCAGTVIGTTTDALSYSTQGTHVITWTFSDGNGNQTIATQNVIIKDVTAPVKPILADLTAECSATATAPTTTDNCAGTVTGTTADAISYTTQGTRIIHWTFNDGNGNKTEATQNVIIKDATAPVKPILADITAECSATATAPTTTDNCAGTVTGTTADAISYTTQGTRIIHWTFNDGNGNKTEATQNVIIKDVTAPVQPILANITAECSATASTPTTTDNCAGTITGTTSDPLFYNKQGNYIIHWRFDDGNGNKTEATQNIVIKDVTSPVVKCPSVAAAYCYSSSGNYNIPELRATDNCNVASVTYKVYKADGTVGRTGSGVNASGALPVGTSTIFWVVKDDNGNTASCSTTVIVNQKLMAAMSDQYAVNPGGQANTVYIGYGSTGIKYTVVPDGGTAPYTYKWSNNTSGNTAYIEPPTSPGIYTYSVVVTDAASCTTTVTKQITVVDVTCDKDKVQVCQVPKGNTLNQQQICVSTSAVATHLANGSYLGVCKGAVAAAKPAEIVSARAEIKAYPNPNTGIFTVTLSKAQSQRCTIMVTDEMGITIQQKRLTPLNSTNNVTFNLSNQAQGVYFIKVVGENGIQTLRVVVQR